MLAAIVMDTSHTERTRGRASPTGAVILRARERTWLVGAPRVAPIGRRVAEGDPGRVERVDMPALRRLYVALGPSFGAERRSDDEMLAWLRRELAGRRLVALDVTPETAGLEPNPRRRSVIAAEMPGGLPVSVTSIVPFIGASTRLTFHDRCLEALLRVPALLNRQDREAFYAQLAPERLTGAALALAAWTREVDEGPERDIDPALVRLAFNLAGWEGLDAMDRLVQAGESILAAQGDLDLDAATSMLAGAVVELGPATFFRLTTRQSAQSPPPIGATEGALVRWAAFIGTLEFDRFDLGRGAIWGPLGTRAAGMAARQAAREGQLTLRTALGPTDFENRRLAEFGPSATSPLAKRVWEMVQVRFIRQLRGTLTVYVDGLPPETSSSAISPNRAGGRNLDLRQVGQAEAAQDFAMLGAMGVLKPLLGHAIVDVTFVDVNGGGRVRFDRVGRRLGS